jgi:hypothetical protein
MALRLTKLDRNTNGQRKKKKRVRSRWEIEPSPPKSRESQAPRRHICCLIRLCSVLAKSERLDASGACVVAVVDLTPVVKPTNLTAEPAISNRFQTRSLVFFFFF